MIQKPRTRLEPRRFVAADIAGWSERLKTSVRWAAVWSAVKVLAGFATGGWALVADGISSGSELLGTFLIGLASRKPEERIGRLLLRGITALLLFTTGVIILRLGFNGILSPGPQLPVLYLVTACLSMAGQFITARYAAARQQMTSSHLSVYRVLAANVLSSVFITIAAAACNIAGWQEADSLMVIGIGVVAILKSASGLRSLITDLLESPQTEPGMLDVASVLCSHPLVEETHSLRLIRSSGGPILKASIVLARDQFGEALAIKTALEHRVREEFGVTRLDLRYELRPGTGARWLGRAVFDQHMLN